MAKDDLIKLIKKYIVLHKQLKTKNEGKHICISLKTSWSYEKRKTQLLSELFP